MTEPKLEMTFDPSTIEHLGIRMYSTLPPVIAELVANAYDADATEVRIELRDNDEKAIIVSDNGSGMTFDEINDSYLRIGRNRRLASSDTTPMGRKVIGKKGLGKLSFFGISNTVDISTVKDGVENRFVMNLEAILALSEGSYSPQILKFNEEVRKPNGTTIFLHDIKRRTEFSAEQLARSLARMFIIERDFIVTVSHNDEKPIVVDKELRFSGINKEFEWKIPEDCGGSDKDYPTHKSIRGLIVTSEKPLSPHMRGVILYSRGKLVNNPSSFVQGDSSHFFSYMAGWLDVSFVDDLQEEVISTNRQSLSWETPETAELNTWLGKLIRSIEKDWRKKRTEKNKGEIQRASNIDIDSWVSANNGEEAEIIKTVVDNIVNAPETEPEDAKRVLDAVHRIVPEHAKYYWRHFHRNVKEASYDYYVHANYYTAVLETVKKYIHAVRDKSNLSDQQIPEHNLLEKVFANRNPVLKVALGYLKSDNTPFSEETLDNIEKGNKGFALAVWDGVRNPISHEEISELRESDLFSERDCLDALSILSYLFRRLDNAQKSDQDEE